MQPLYTSSWIEFSRRSIGSRFRGPRRHTSAPAGSTPASGRGTRPDAGGPPLRLQAPHQARQAGVVPERVRPARQQGPADIEREQVQAVGLAIGPHLLDLAARHHGGDLRSLAADLAGQADGGRNILQAEVAAGAVVGQLLHQIAVPVRGIALGVAVPLARALEPRRGREAVDHRPQPQHRQVEALAVPGTTRALRRRNTATTPAGASARPSRLRRRCGSIRPGSARRRRPPPAGPRRRRSRPPGATSGWGRTCRPASRWGPGPGRGWSRYPGTTGESCDIAAPVGQTQAGPDGGSAAQATRTNEERSGIAVGRSRRCRSFRRATQKLVSAL